MLPRQVVIPLLLGAILGCRGGPEEQQAPSGPPEAAADSVARGRHEVRSIETVQEAHTPALMAIEGVVGTYVGVTDGGAPCIRVMVVRKTAALAARIPKQLEGYPVELIESGEIRPLPGARP